MTRIHLAVKATAATLLTICLVVGVPAGLIHYVGSPLPSSLPTLDEVQLALRSGIDPQLVVNSIAVVVWILWLQLAATLTVEVVAVAGGTTARILPVLPGLQQTTARLVATITLIGATLTPIKPPPALALTYTATVEHHQPTTIQVTSHDQPSETVAESKTSLVSYTTRRLDTLWGIAERTLGDGRRWQEIHQLNPDHTNTDGSVTAGAHLLLPADATPNPPSVPDEVRVEEGDHFWSIAETALAGAWGRPPTDAEIHSYWRQVIDANRDRLAPPGDPDLIYRGQVFQLPPVPANPDRTEPNKMDSEVGGSEVTVEQGDHMWSIAETALADAWDRQPTDSEIIPYWGELIEGNRDQLVNRDSPSLILPGQTFHLPPIPSDPDIRATGQPVSTTDPKPAVEPPAEPSTPQESGTTGEVAEPESTPPSTEATTATTTPAAEETVQPDPDPEVTEPASEPATKPGDVPADDDERGLLPTAAPIIGLGILATAVIALIDRLRRRQLQHRKPNTIPTRPPAKALQVEAELRTAASLEAVDLVDVALRSLGRQIVDSHLPAPHVVGVHISDHHLKLLLWTPHPDPPDGWRSEDDGSTWTLPTNTELTHLRLLADGNPAPYPSLVTAGHDGGSQLLVDLEFLGAVTITGTPEDVLAACRTMATELASSPIADHMEVVCVGFGADLADLERVTVVDQLDPRLLDRLDDDAHRLGDVEAGMLVARLGPGGDATYPTVIIDPSPAAPEGADRLLAAAQTGRGVAAVVGYPTGDRWKLHISDGTVRVEPLGFSLSRRDLTSEEHQGVTDLMAAARDLEGTPVETGEPVVFSPNGHHPDQHEEADTPESEPTQNIEEESEDLEVRVLGTIRIDGLEGHFASRKAAELPVYMALHRGGVEADTIMEALWPGEAPDINRFNRTTSRARTPLGTTSNGDLYLPRFDGTLYRVNPLLGCDLDRFTSYVNRAGQTDLPEDKIAYLEAALELVEGTPFSGAGNGYTWAWSEGLVSHAIVAVDDTAHHLAQSALDSGDPQVASWAARKGLLSTTRCEECYRNLMRAAIAEGSRTALDAIFTELTTVMDADDGPDAETWLEPETVELYERHSRRTTTPDSNRQ